MIFQQHQRGRQQPRKVTIRWKMRYVYSTPLPLTKDEIDPFEKVGPASPVGLPESLNISSDLEIVPSSQGVGDPQQSKEVGRPAIEPFDFGKPVSMWSRWGSNAHDEAPLSPTLALAMYEEVASPAPPAPSAPKDKKSTKKGKKL